MTYGGAKDTRGMVIFINQNNLTTPGLIKKTTNRKIIVLKWKVSNNRSTYNLQQTAKPLSLSMGYKAIKGIFVVKDAYSTILMRLPNIRLKHVYHREVYYLFFLFFPVVHNSYSAFVFNLLLGWNKKKA